MVTTIQLHESVKNELDKLKETVRESYEDTILKLIHAVEKQKKLQAQLMIEGYQKTSAESLKTAKEWSSTETSWD